MIGGRDHGPASVAKYGAATAPTWIQSSIGARSPRAASCATKAAAAFVSPTPAARTAAPRSSRAPRAFDTNGPAGPDGGDVIAAEDEIERALVIVVIAAERDDPAVSSSQKLVLCAAKRVTPTARATARRFRVPSSGPAR